MASALKHGELSVPVPDQMGISQINVSGMEMELQRIYPKDRGQGQQPEVIFR